MNHQITLPKMAGRQLCVSMFCRRGCLPAREHRRDPAFQGGRCGAARAQPLQQFVEESAFECPLVPNSIICGVEKK